MIKHNVAAFDNYECNHQALTIKQFKEIWIITYLHSLDIQDTDVNARIKID